MVNGTWRWIRYHILVGKGDAKIRGMFKKEVKDLKKKQQPFNKLKIVSIEYTITIVRNELRLE